MADLLQSPFRTSPPGVTAFQKDYDPPVVYNWSFGIQQNIGWGSVLDVAYVGSVARHLMHRRSLNSLTYGTRFLPSSIDPTTGNTPLPDNFLRPMPGYADIQYLEFASNSNYHSMQTQVNKRFSKGLMFGLSWTWSKSMNFVNGNGDAVNPFLDFRMRNYGKGNFDRTHNFVFNYTYNIPKLSSVWDNPGRQVGLRQLGRRRRHLIHQRRAVGRRLLAGQRSRPHRRQRRRRRQPHQRSVESNPPQERTDRTAPLQHRASSRRPPAPNSASATPPRTSSAAPAPTSSTFRSTRTSRWLGERPLPPAAPLRVLQLLQPRQLPGCRHHGPLRRSRPAGQRHLRTVHLNA